MILGVPIPSFASVEELLDWCEERGKILRVYVLRGADDLLRGLAIFELPD